MLVRFAAVARLAIVLGLLAVSGCDSPAYYSLDGGPTPDTSVAPLSLTLDSAPSLVLGFTERTTIEVTLTELGGAPVEGETIAFSLDGAPADTSLVADAARTDANGHATVEVVAGFAPATFRVRGAHPRARLVFVDVAVGAEFGTLRVEPRYDGARALASTSVHVYSDRDCAAALADPTGGLERTLPAGSTSVELTSLPVGLTYTVMARALGDSGALVAAGCIGNVTLTAAAPTTAPVSLRDTAIGYDGTYAWMLALDATGAVDPTELGGRVLAALGGASGDATRAVDALAADLTAAGDVTGAALVEAERLRLEADLAAALRTAGPAPSDRLATEVSASAALLATMALPGWLAIGLVADPTVTAEGLQLGGPDDSLVLDATVLPSPPTLTSHLDAPNDALVVDALELALPLGDLLSRVLVARAVARGATGLAVSLDAGACTLVAGRIEADATIAPLCGPDCRARVCAGMLEAVVADFGAVAGELDVAWSHITLAGTLASTDTDGDAQTDVWAGTLEGVWDDGSGTGSGGVVGLSSATRPLR